MYTDGFTEARNITGRYGTSRVEHSAARAAHQSVADLLDAMIDQARFRESCPTEHGRRDCARDPKGMKV